VVARAGINGVTFHDLRGTAVTRLALAGCTVPEIASITGHSLKEVNGILDSHYLSRDAGLAEQAIRKREAHEAGEIFPTALPTDNSRSELSDRPVNDIRGIVGSGGGI